MSCVPGAALAGIVTEPLMLPVLDATNRRVSTVSTYTSTASSPKPVPDTVTTVLGWPDVGESLTAVAACPATVVARTRIGSNGKKRHTHRSDPSRRLRAKNIAEVEIDAMD